MKNVKVKGEAEQPPAHSITALLRVLRQVVCVSGDVASFWPLTPPATHKLAPLHNSSYTRTHRVNDKTCIK